jgi:hypothetical protein
MNCMLKTYTAAGILKMHNRTFWDKRAIAAIMVFTMVTFITVCLLFFDNLVDASYILGGLTVTVLYFLLMNYCFHVWIDLPPALFQWYLFITSLAVRVTAALALYFFYKMQTGEPFEPQAIDSKFYHYTAIQIAQHFRQMDFHISGYLSELSFSDQGYNIFLGVLYSVFGPSVIIIRIINAIFSAATVWLIYKTAAAVVDDYAARIAGIMAVFLPNFLLYLGTHLKESLMVFLVVAALYQIIQFVQYRKRNIWLIFSLLALLFVLFMFRTVLAGVMLATLAAYTIVNHRFQNKVLNIAALLALLVMFGWLIGTTSVGAEIAEYVEKKNAISDHMEFRASRDGGNKLALLAGAPLFISVIFMAPFPSMVFVPEQNPLWMFIGANLIRNIYAFFTMAGIIYLVRHQFKRSSVIVIFTLGYLGVLANSGFAISERFHMPVVPCLLILAATGVSHKSIHTQRYFNAYLALIFIVIIGWNYVKLAGRM